jgi:hypothetical protein
MNITIDAENRSDYLYIVSKGDVKSAEDLAIHANLIHDEFLKYNPKKILLYEMETNFLLGLSTYIEITSHYDDNFIDDMKFIKIAAIIQKKYKNIGDFWETVCTNRGFDYRAFTDPEEAEQWLLK